MAADHKTIAKLNETIEHLEKEVESVSKLAAERKKEIEKYIAEISQFTNQQKKLEKTISDQESKIAQMDIKIQSLEAEKKLLVQSYQELQKTNEIDQQVNQSLNRNLEINSFNSMIKSDTDNFYEGIIRISSLKDLETGWEVTYRDFDHYSRKSKDPSIILSVVGCDNTGKTWLLGKLCNLSGIPEGFSCSTEGISFAYTTKEEGKDSKIAPVLVLDSQGISKPVRVDGIVGEEGAPNSNGESLIQEDIYSKRFKERLTDHVSTEDLLHSFISAKSTVNIIVVSDLKFEDQKLINKLKKRPGNTIIVVHNLYHCTRVEEVENIKLKQTILPSFNLVEKKYGFETTGNHRYFEEVLPNRTIVHLIMAKDNTDAGKHYNPSSLKYLKQLYEIAPTKIFDVVSEFHSFLRTYLPTYMQLENSSQISLTPLENKSKEEKFSQSFMLSGSDKMILKPVSADEFGLLNSNLQAYCVFVDGKEKRITVKIECPGFFDPKDILVKTEPQGTKYRLWIKGKKMNDDNEASDIKVIHDVRKQGEFNLVTPWLSSLDYDISALKNTKKIDFSKGCVLISYQYETKGEWE